MHEGHYNLYYMRAFAWKFREIISMIFFVWPKETKKAMYLKAINSYLSKQYSSHRFFFRQRESLMNFLCSWPKQYFYESLLLFLCNRIYTYYVYFLTSSLVNYLYESVTCVYFLTVYIYYLKILVYVLYICFLN